MQTGDFGRGGLTLAREGGRFSDAEPKAVGPLHRLEVAGLRQRRTNRSVDIRHGWRELPEPASCAVSVSIVM